MQMFADVIAFCLFREIMKAWWRNQSYFMRISNSLLGLLKRTVSCSTLAALLEIKLR